MAEERASLRTKIMKAKESTKKAQGKSKGGFLSKAKKYAKTAKKYHKKASSYESPMFGDDMGGGGGIFGSNFLGTMPTEKRKGRKRVRTCDDDFGINFG